MPDFVYMHADLAAERTQGGRVRMCSGHWRHPRWDFLLFEERAAQLQGKRPMLSLASVRVCVNVCFKIGRLLLIPAHDVVRGHVV